MTCGCRADVIVEMVGGARPALASDVRLRHAGIAYCPLHAAAEQLAGLLSAFASSSAESEVNARRLGIGEAWVQARALLKEIGR